MTAARRLGEGTEHMGGDPERAPTAAQMTHYVAGFVKRITARNRLPLDYSVASLRVVDFVVDGLRKGGADQGSVRGTLFGLGAYAGEVMVRRAGGAWTDFDVSQRELFGQPVGIRMPDGRVWNPLGKVVNRFDAGAEESVRGLYLQLHGRARRPSLDSAA